MFHLFNRRSAEGTGQNRAPKDGSKIVIAGTGRAGTTFLVQLFTALGFDTGFSLEQSLREVDSLSSAGLEKRLADSGNPYVVKSPWLADQLGAALDSGQFQIRAAILPMRRLEDASESRRRVAREAENRDLSPNHPGGLWETADPALQEDILLRKLYATLLPLAAHNIPLYLMIFPRLARDPAYLFEALQPLMAAHGVNKREFSAAFAKVARPELIHSFG